MSNTAATLETRKGTTVLPEKKTYLQKLLLVENRLVDEWTGMPEPVCKAGRFRLVDAGGDRCDPSHDNSSDTR